MKVSEETSGSTYKGVVFHQIMAGTLKSAPLSLPAPIGHISPRRRISAVDQQIFLTSEEQTRQVILHPTAQLFPSSRGIF